MAASSPLSLHLLLLFSLLSLSTIGAYARPCKTLFISYTISTFKPTLQFPQFHHNSDQNPSEFFAIYREFNDFEPKPFHPSSQFLIDRPDLRSPFFAISAEEPHRPEIPRPMPFLGSFGISSLRDRTKDILSVVLALLFGVGCGALTSATMYLVWSVITSRYEIREAGSDSEESDDENPKDMSYVKIPAAPAKEGYEGNQG